MKNIYIHLFEEFNCIKGECPDSCCQGWEVDVDSDTLNSYNELTGSLKDKIYGVLDTDEYKNNIFRLTKGKRCPFLNKMNLCDIHASYGVEYTPLTCRMFPRFINNYGSLTETGMSFSCPVAANLMWNDVNAFNFTENITSEPPGINDIDAGLFYELVEIRSAIFDIINKKNITVKDKAMELIKFAEEAQKSIKPARAGHKKISFFDVLDNYEKINDEWVEKFKNPNDTPIYLNEVAGTNILMYFIYRYFLNAVIDKNVKFPILLSVIGLLIPVYFGNDAWAMHLWSKETEHSDINMQNLKYKISHAACLSGNALTERIDKMITD